MSIKVLSSLCSIEYRTILYITHATRVLRSLAGWLQWIRKDTARYEQGRLEVQPEIACVKFAMWELRMQSISSLLAPILLRINAGYLNTTPLHVQRQLPDQTINPSKFAEIVLGTC